MYRLEHFAPIPTTAAKKPARKKRNSYPFGDMKIGDHFDADHEGKGSQCRAAAAARQFARWWGTCKFEVRDLKNGKVRIWRVK